MKSMKKVVSGSGLETHHVTNRVWRGPKPHPIDKYHMFREVGWDHLGSFWEAFGLVFGTFFDTSPPPDRSKGCIFVGWKTGAEKHEKRVTRGHAGHAANSPLVP